MKTVPAESSGVLTSFEVELPGGIDVAGSLEFLRRHGDDLIDRWDGVSLVRTLPIGDRSVAYSCKVNAAYSSQLTVTVNGIADGNIKSAIRSTFLPSPSGFSDVLANDAVLRMLHARFPGIRPVRQFDLLAALIRCISAQQVNLKWAVTTRRRLALRFGDEHLVDRKVVYSFSAERLASASVAAIRELQFTNRKSEYIIAAAEAVASGALEREALSMMPDQEVVTRLTALRGVGPWTAEWILLRTLGRPCVVATDLVVRKAIGMAYFGGNHRVPSEREVREVTSHWGASSAVLQTLVLHGLDEGALNGVGTPLG